MTRQMSFIVMLAMALILAATAGQPAQASVLAPAASGLPRQEGGSSEPYTNELLGLTVSLPAGWQALPGGQNYDLALISPEVFAGGDGAFMTMANIPGLGADTTLESALQPVADQVGGTVEPLTIGANEGVQVKHTDEETGAVQHLVLFPYGEHGEAFYIQTLAPAELDEMVFGILEGLELKPPEPDYDAANAAWQASLAENGRLIYGDPNAPIKMVEFLSFTCSHCTTYSFPVNRLIALDVDSGLVQIELVPIAGDQYAEYATKAAYCATEQGAGYSAYKALFSGYLNLGYQSAYSEDGIDEVLGGLDAGLDMEALKTCIAENPYAEQIEENRTRFTDYGLTGTPTVLLGTADSEVQPLILPDGTVWSGSIPVETLRAIFTLIAEDGIAVEDVISHLTGEAQ